MAQFDYVLVGGGLQNGLIAIALRTRQPDIRIALIERETALGGNHTWCFHEADIAAESLGWLDRIVTHAWSGYRVAFPRLERTMDGRYSAVTSQRLHDVASAAVRGGPGSKLLLNTEVSGVDARSVTLDSGDRLRGRVVIDSRGPPAPSDRAPAGYQKFFGLEVQLAMPHDLDLPVLMDATVDQLHGYRFFYVLPLGASRLLIEDTYFHEAPSLDRVRLRDEILGYAASRGWEVTEVIREEAGVLPMPWAGSPRVPRSGPLLGGYRGGWFHPATGYSFPVAVRLAEFVADRPPAELFGAEFRRFARRHLRQVRFAQLLNRFLFRWYPPPARVPIFERFYRMSSTTIGHFYALRLSWADGFRLLMGRPPAGLSLRYRFRHGTDR